MVTLEQKVDLLMRWATETDFDECRRLVNEMRNILDDSDVTPSVDISSPAAIDGLVTDIVDDLFKELGCSANRRGYDQAAYAIKLVVSDDTYLRYISKRLYPDVAKKFDTTPSRAERNIRHLVELAFYRNDPKDTYRIFGNSVDPAKGKLTNSEFIAACARIVKRRMREHGVNV